jgi:release factor glutamine methyltransferase
VESDLLLAAILKQSREFLLAHGRDDVLPRHARKFQHLLRERRRGVPLPYLTGEKEFFGRTFIVTPAVMIPRPETEALAEEALRRVRAMDLSRPIVADIGTGSGVLAVTIAVETHRTRVVAVDRSGAALNVARRNARHHHALRRITFLESDLLQEIPEELTPHIIVANLPYVSSEHLKHAGDHPDTRGLAFEPQRALDGGPDGLYVIRRFFAQFRRFPHIRSSFHHLILEHSPTERHRILELAGSALPELAPHEIAPFATCWTRTHP